MVAIQMVAGRKKVPIPSLDTILDSARERGYSISGELFSASNLAELGRLHVSQMEFETVPWDSADSIITALEKGHLVLVAYDKDGNNEPCLKGGTKAHWCLVNGYAYPDEGSGGDDGHLRAIQGEFGGSEVTIEARFSELDSEQSTAPALDANELFLLCYHGKSPHQAVWPYEDLRKSNANLDSVGPEVLSSPEKYAVPDKGRLDGLRQNIVIAK
jgi:hypothetical protein